MPSDETTVMETPAQPEPETVPDSALVRRVEFDTAMRTLGGMLGFRSFRTWPGKVGGASTHLMIPHKDGTYLLEIIKDLIEEKRAMAREINATREQVLALGDWLGQEWSADRKRWVGIETAADKPEKE